MSRIEFDPLFPLGRVQVTARARTSVPPCELTEALVRHMRGHWTGDLNETGQLRFPFALDGCRVLGTYRSPNGRRVWMITEADRSLTTVMLPEEFL